jgi:hypothetical protein
MLLSLVLESVLVVAEPTTIVSDLLRVTGGHKDSSVLDITWLLMSDK